LNFAGSGAVPLMNGFTRKVDPVEAHDLVADAVSPGRFRFP
jgi:hypothetical protein